MDDLQSTVRRHRHAAACEHPIAAGEVAPHIRRQVKPYEANRARPPRACSRSRHAAVASRRHRAPGIGRSAIAKVAFDDGDHPGLESQHRGADAPVLVARWKMENEIGRGCDSALGQRLGALGSDSRHRGDGSIDAQRAAFRDRSIVLTGER